MFWSFECLKFWEKKFVVERGPDMENVADNLFIKKEAISKFGFWIKHQLIEDMMSDCESHGQAFKKVDLNRWHFLACNWIAHLDNSTLWILVDAYKNRIKILF